MKLTRRERQEGGGLMSPEGGFGPLAELHRLRREIDRLITAPLGLLAPNLSLFHNWAPPVDIFEDKDKYIVKAELPGMKREEIDVSLDGNTLTISGERKQEEEKKEGESYRSERYFGRFQRSVTLPTEVQVNKIEAAYKDGVLKITLPKSEETKPKQIQIKS